LTGFQPNQSRLVLTPIIVFQTLLPHITQA
jgi:hypothetical protein